MTSPLEALAAVAYAAAEGIDVSPYHLRDAAHNLAARLAVVEAIARAAISSEEVPR